MPCRLIDILVHPCGNCREHCRSQGTGLFRADHTDGHVQHVRQRLHHEGRLLADTSDGIDRINAQPLALHMLHNTAGTEGGGFHQRTEYFRGAGTQRESRNGTLHVLVRIGGTAAVHPVQGDNTVLGGFYVLGLTGEFHQHAVQNFLPGLPSGDIFQCPCQHLPEPGVDVSESRLPGFETDESRKHRTVHLAADSLDTASAYLVFAGNHDVAGGCSHDTCQYPRGDGCAYGSHMGVQRPHGHGDSSGKSKPVCPLGCQFPCLGVAGVGFCEQMGEHFLQGRIKFFENFAGRKTPTGMPHCFMSSSTTATKDLFRNSVTSY